jgi:hypothetical protein
MHGACAALAVVAAFLGAREPDGLTQAIQERRPGIECKPVFGSVDAQTHVYGAVSAGRGLEFHG